MDMTANALRQLSTDKLGAVVGKDIGESALKGQG